MIDTFVIREGAWNWENAEDAGEQIDEETEEFWNEGSLSREECAKIELTTMMMVMVVAVTVMKMIVMATMMMMMTMMGTTEISGPKNQTHHSQCLILGHRLF